MRVLIADDDSLRVERFRAYLLAESVLHAEDIYVAHTGDAAKKLLKSLYFDVLVLDVVLPKRADLHPDAAVGLDLLEQLGRNGKLRKPEKIVGITAHFSDIQMFRERFENHCQIVIEAPSNSDVWKKRIVDSLRYTGASKLSRVASETQISVLSVHGIRTFGQWQGRLRKLAEAETQGIVFRTYKFGYFSSLGFLVPKLRARQAEQLAKSIELNIARVEGKHLYIFCHSFGTYLVAQAIKHLLARGIQFPRTTLVLCGSVLEPDFDWGFLRQGSFNVVNDCGDRDLILWLSRALVFGAGMAGKVGFHCFSGGFLVNRYFRGGHSLYFDGDSFMRTHWLSILENHGVASDVDDRQSTPFVLNSVEKFVNLLGIIKDVIWSPR